MRRVPSGKLVLACLAVGLMVVGLAGCRSLFRFERRVTPPIAEYVPPERSISFFTIVRPTDDREITFELGVTGGNEIPSCVDLPATYALHNPGGSLRASGRTLATAHGHGERVLVTWRSELEPGTYTLVWGARGFGGTTKRFDVIERDGRLWIGATSEYYSSDESYAEQFGHGYSYDYALDYRYESDYSYSYDHRYAYDPGTRAPFEVVYRLLPR